MPRKPNKIRELRFYKRGHPRLGGKFYGLIKTDKFDRVFRIDKSKRVK